MSFFAVTLGCGIFLWEDKMQNSRFLLTITFLFISSMSLAFAIVTPNQNSFRPDFALGQVVFSPLDANALAEIKVIAADNNATVHRITRDLEIYVYNWQPEIDFDSWNRAVLANDLTTRKAIHRSAEPEVIENLRMLESTGLVKWTTPNYYKYIQFIPNDPYFVNSASPTPTNPPNQWDKFIMQCPQAWDIQRGNPNILIAILDSGVDVDHPDLKDNIWINPGEDIENRGTIDLVYDYEYINGIDDDGNGFVDDLFGYDFVGGVTGNEATTPPDQQDWNPDIHYFGDDGWGEPDPSVGNGVGSWMGTDVGVSHGTHCAGIAAAVMDNATMFAGVAGGGCKIVPVRVANPEGQATVTAIAAGIEYAAIVGAHVISMSLGGLGGSDPAQAAAIDYAFSMGVTLVAASGNMAPLVTAVSYPASDPDVIAVGSCTAGGNRSSYSQYGSNLDVVAPGGQSSFFGDITETIWSTWVVSVFEANEDPSLSPADHIYMHAVGTSMACPQVSGICGLILSQNPSLTNVQVREVLTLTATDIGAAGFDNETGYGMANAYEAVHYVSNIAEQSRLPENSYLSITPNPFNAACKISSKNEIEIFNVSGRLVKRLTPNSDSEVVWDGTSENGENLPSGVYLARTNTPNGRTTKAITLLK